MLYITYRLVQNNSYLGSVVYMMVDVAFFRKSMHLLACRNGPHFGKNVGLLEGKLRGSSQGFLIVQMCLCFVHPGVCVLHSSIPDSNSYLKSIQAS